MGTGKNNSPEKLISNPSPYSGLPHSLCRLWAMDVEQLAVESSLGCRLRQGHQVVHCPFVVGKLSPGIVDLVQFPQHA